MRKILALLLILFVYSGTAVADDDWFSNFFGFGSTPTPTPAPSPRPRARPRSPSPDDADLDSRTDTKKRRVPEPEPEPGSAIEQTQTYQYWIQESLRRAQKIEPRCPGCDLFVKGRSDEQDTPSCRQTYKDLYHVKDRIEQEKPSDRVIDMRIAIGYMDVVNAVEDHFVEAAFLADLSGGCRDKQFACGFKQDPDDPELLTKQIQVMGPDGKMRTREVRLQLRASSATTSEKSNRAESEEAQRKQTQDTQDFYIEGLTKSDLLLYVGHARDGGGPDFSPPVINPKTKRTDFDWYHKNEPGVKRMREALSGASKTPRILGIFACYAEDHFSDFLKEAAPKSGLVLAGKSQFQSIAGQAMATLDSALAMRCEGEFAKAVNVLDRIDAYDVTPVLIDGVFRKN